MRLKQAFKLERQRKRERENIEKVDNKQVKMMRMIAAANCQA